MFGYVWGVGCRHPVIIIHSDKSDAEGQQQHLI